METSTMLCVMLIFLIALASSFFLGYQTGYLRYVSMYEETLDQLIQITKREIENGSETLQENSENKIAD